MRGKRLCVPCLLGILSAIMSYTKTANFLTNLAITGLSMPYLNNVDFTNHAAYVWATGGVRGIALLYAAQLSKTSTIIWSFHYSPMDAARFVHGSFSTIYSRPFQWKRP